MRTMRVAPPANAARSDPTPLEPLAPAGYGQLRCTTCQREAVMAAQSRVGRRTFFSDTGAASRPARPALAFAQGTTERKIDPLALPLDKPDVWTLHFRYKPPRITEVDALDKNGNKVKKTVWYMWYQVYNRSGEPQTCLPEFELVTKDLNTTHLDEPQPYIFEQIKKIEDTTITPEKPNGYYDFQTSIGISKRPIPPSMPDAIPCMVSGLAIWTDMAEKAPEDQQVHHLHHGTVERPGRRGNGDRRETHQAEDAADQLPPPDRRQAAAGERHRPGRPQHPGREVDLPHRVDAQGEEAVRSLSHNHRLLAGGPRQHNDAVVRPGEFQSPAQLLRID